jgi:cytochrome c-type biogenesis protein CcmE
MNRRYYYLTGFIVIALFLVLAFSSFRESITPYVSFSEAKASGETVQIIGKLVPGSSVYDTSLVALSFQLLSTLGEPMPVVYSSGPKPANFEETTEIVVIGKYDGEKFVADQLLVKCPSKYQGSLN